MPIILFLLTLAMGTHLSKTPETQRPNILQDSRPSLVMLGDSTLDNIVWVGSYDNCIKAQLQRLNPNHNVINLAADGFTSGNVLEGLYPSISYSHRKNVDPYPIFDN